MDNQILDKFVNDFESEKDLAQGIEKAFNNLPQGFFDIEQIKANNIAITKANIKNAIENLSNLINELDYQLYNTDQEIDKNLATVIGLLNNINLN